MTAFFSLGEAGFLTGQSTAAINRAIDRKEIDAHGSREENGARRIDSAELRALAAIGAVGRDLTPTGRRKVSAAVRQLGAGETKIGIGVLALDLNDLDRRITERLFRLEALRQLVEPQDTGDPLIRGTRFSVYAIAAFARSESTAEIIEDCPGLTPELIEAAAKYATVYPRAGRPLPTRCFKRMLMDLGNLGVWDVEADDDPLPP